EGQPAILVLITYAHVQKPRSIEDRGQLKGPPCNRLIRVDLGEQTTRLLRSRFHQRPVPAPADSYADILHVLRQAFDQLVLALLAHRRNAAADVDQMRLAAVLEHLAGIGQSASE